MVVIVDYNVGNLSSIKNMLKRCGLDAVISSDREVIANADKFILPGVGSFDHGISNLKASAYFDILSDKVLNRKVPILGVCLGAQLLADSSEEGCLPGLSWIRGRVVKFKKEHFIDNKLKVPHMGWSDVYVKNDSILFKDMFPEPRFYFVHSYHWICEDQADEMATANYGYEFTAGVEAGNILGVQFHPEKSHKYGMRLYENFVKHY